MKRPAGGMFDEEDDADSLIEIDSGDESNGGTKKMKTRVRNTAVHDEFKRYFKQLLGGKKEERSQCKHCSANYSGKNPTTLIKHLKSKHAKLATEVEKKDNKQRQEMIEVKNEGSSKSSSNLKTASEALFGVKGRNSKMEISTRWTATYR